MLNMSNYYTKNLAAGRLKKCYDLAPGRVRQYLEAEIETVRARIKHGDHVLELGCGYGRVLAALQGETDNLFGIDLSVENLHFARHEFLSGHTVCLFAMDAYNLAFRTPLFDLVFCIQNGISAFGGEAGKLIREAIRVTRPGGTVFFSSYASKFWSQRLHWFKVQAVHGLIGEIDYECSGNGIIVCKDGFRATTFSPANFANLLNGLNCTGHVFEIDNSAVFCEIRV